MSDTGISIFPTNLGMYNEGMLCGAWLDLPVDPDTLVPWLREHCRYLAPRWDGGVYEELFVTDYELPASVADTGVGQVIRDAGCGEYIPLRVWNLMATMLDDLPDYEHEAVRLAVEQGWCDDVCEFLNLVEQADDLPYYTYGWSGDRYNEYERIGLEFADATDMLAKLEDMGMSDFVDWERYGKSLAYDYAMGDNGYLDCSQNGPNTSLYDIEELLEMHGLTTDEDEDEDEPEEM